MPKVDARRDAVDAVYLAKYASKSSKYNSLMWPTEEQTAGEEALQKLRQGNLRFSFGRPKHSAITKERLCEVAAEQKPFACVVTCSDSRVQPEQIFDQELGDVFVVRMAAGVLNEHALASVLFALEALGARLVITLGHSRCGPCFSAVHEAVKSGMYALTPSKDGSSFAFCNPGSNGMRDNWQLPYLSFIANCQNNSSASLEKGKRHPALSVLDSITPAINRVAERRIHSIRAQADHQPVACASSSPEPASLYHLIDDSMDTVEEVAQVNAQLTGDAMRKSLQEWLPQDVYQEVKVVAAYYDLCTGLVKFL